MSLLPPGLAYAMARAETAGDHSVTSGTWKVVPSPGLFSLVSVVTPPAPQYTTVRNTGTLGLVGTTYSINVSGLTLGTVSVRACSGTWNESTHACSGGSTTTIVTSASTTNSVSALGLFPDEPGDTVRLQVSLNQPAAVPVIVTMTVSATRSQVRAATTTAS